MPGLNFKKRFAPAVERGDKGCTIRQRRKRPIVAGQTLYLFAGQRTSACRRIGEHRCLLVVEAEISHRGVDLGGHLLSNGHCDDLARHDGFAGWDGFVQFFDAEHGLPFVGDWIVWKPELVDWWHEVQETERTI